ncbi:MAG TPA: lytic murein transglycosylase, partial [Burkholderiales bacterium]|nr:lytic murein transglycosylase [Burkholderiales bacterium]
MRRGRGPGFARAALLAALVVPAAPAQTPPDEFRPVRSEVESFIRYMEGTHGFDARELHRLFSRLKPSEGVQRAISAPTTAKPWHEFRSLFVDQARVENGA